MYEVTLSESVWVFSASDMFGYQAMIGSASATWVLHVITCSTGLAIKGSMMHPLLVIHTEDSSAPPFMPDQQCLDDLV